MALGKRNIPENRAFVNLGSEGKANDPFLGEKEIFPQPRPPVEIIDRCELMQGDNNPKQHLVARLGNFVAENTLGDKCAGPTAENLRAMQSKFRRSPPAGLGTNLAIILRRLEEMMVKLKVTLGDVSG